MRQAAGYGAAPSGAGAGFPGAAAYGGHTGVPAGGPVAPQVGKYQAYNAPGEANREGKIVIN